MKLAYVPDAWRIARARRKTAVEEGRAASVSAWEIAVNVAGLAFAAVLAVSGRPILLAALVAFYVVGFPVLLAYELRRVRKKRREASNAANRPR